MISDQCTHKVEQLALVCKQRLHAAVHAPPCPTLAVAMWLRHCTDGAAAAPGNVERRQWCCTGQAAAVAAAGIMTVTDHAAHVADMRHEQAAEGGHVC